MKGGLTILLHVVKLLISQGYDRYPIKIILAGDEETGHRNSNGGKDYMEEAKGALMGFNLETGFPDNGIVIERKGVAQYQFDVDGIGAHAGNNPKDGRSAVIELCHKALDMESLTDYEEGTTVNVGVFPAVPWPMLYRNMHPAGWMCDIPGKRESKGREGIQRDCGEDLCTGD